MVDLKGFRVVAQAIVPGEWVGQGVCHEWMCMQLPVCSAVEYVGVSDAPPTTPGLLQADPNSFIRYGAMDNKEEFKTDKEFMKLVRSQPRMCLCMQGPLLSPSTV